MRTRCGLLATGVVAVWFLLTGVATGQPDPSFSTVVDGIKRADPASIRRAGDSGDAAYIPYLRDAAFDVRLGAASMGVTIALAKLEDRETQQMMFCAVVGQSTTAPVGYMVSIGGWYAIRALDAMLTGAGQAQFRRAVESWGASDIGYLPPSFYAVDALPKVVPNPPITVGNEQMTELEQQSAPARWHQWIAEHRDELSYLRPVGNGVQYTDEACAKRK